VTRRDISIPMGASTPEWPGDTPFSCGWSWEMAKGASVNVGVVTTSLHVGTHADAPLHVLQGAPASDALPLDAFSGPALVVDAQDASAGPTLSVAWLETALDGLPMPARLLLRTGRTVAGGQFPLDWPVLTPEATSWLLQGGLKLLGMDAPSVDAREAKELVNHRLLFSGGACLLENLQLDGVDAGIYQLTAYPVLISGADAAPVRAVLEPLHGPE
jgi:arylformamidase